MYPQIASVISGFDSRKIANTFLQILILSLLFFACTGIVRTSQAANTSATTWYVSEMGLDANNCLSPLTACRSIQAAADKAVAGDVIRVAQGVYYGADKYVLEVGKDLSLLGGWNSEFTAQVGMSEINSQSARTGVYIGQGVISDMDRFIIRDGYGEFSGGIVNDGTLALTNAQVISNTVDLIGFNCYGGGIHTNGLIKISDSLVSENICPEIITSGDGGGLYIAGYPASAVITNTSIVKNAAWRGGGISNSNSLILVNSTVSENNAGFIGYTGGGIQNNGYKMKIYNSTISGNNAEFMGGGIFTSDDPAYDVSLSNSIVDGNSANNSRDCFGRIVSEGYNLMGDSSGCDFVSLGSDFVNEDASLTPLGDYGGPGPTHAFYQGSPAVDGGNPGGCVDAAGETLDRDQRGKIRPLDGDGNGSAICDIGSVEITPDELLEPPPTNIWYVSTTGSDLYDCHSTGSPCQSINAAIQKAGNGDALYITAGVFTGVGEQVVTLDRNLTLSGGWTGTFSAQTGWTVIDAQTVRRGIRVLENVIAEIENFQVQNAESLDGYGAGISILYRGDVSFSNLRLYNNRGYGEGVEIIADGGGLFLGNGANADVKNCEMRANTANDGGAILVSNGSLDMENCLIEDNLAYSEGGAIWSGGTVTGNNVQILYNRALSVGNTGGGGVFSSRLTLNDSVVSGNQAPFGSGGGIYEGTVFLNNTLVSRNRAMMGGGIAFGNVTMNGSSITQNWAVESGGGLYVANVRGSNNTIAGNISYADGGGFYSGLVDLSYTTVSKNTALRSGGGVINMGELKIKATLIAGNQAPVIPDCQGSVISEGYNLIEKSLNCQASAQATDLLGVDPLLGPAYGYPATITLFPQSPAIDGGPDTCTDTQGNPVESDQRGKLRPIDGDLDGNPACDIGAYEYDSMNPMRRIYLPSVNAAYDYRTFTDDFGDPFSGFKAYRDASLFGGYTLDGYFRILMQDGGRSLLSTAPAKTGNVFSVRTMAWWGYVPGSQYGLVFGQSESGDRYYVYLVNAGAQTYQVLKYEDGNLVAVVPVTYSSAIHSGSQANDLELRNNGDAFELLVNQVSLGTWMDASFPHSGRVGLFANSWGMNQSTEAFFDDFSLMN